MTTILELTCRDPIVSRDGRPFGVGQGNRMRSAGWLLPSVVAGSLRSTIGKAAQRDFSADVARDLLSMEIGGAFPQVKDTIYLPAPQDCVVHPDHGPLRATPQKIDAAGCDWPSAELWPVALTDAQVSEEFKPLAAPAWWPVDRYAAWLTGGKFGFNDLFLRAAETEYRTHVQIAPDVGAAEDSNIFTTAALSLSHLPRHVVADRDATGAARFAAITLAARVRGSGWCAEQATGLDTFHPLGGERRLVHWKAATARSWDCPGEVRRALSPTSKIRMVLTTPAVFSDGWKPAWLDESLKGRPPGVKVILKLVGVSIERWRAVSGWSLASLPGQPRGPKPVKRIVPSGGVYFFEVVEGLASELADHWLVPVSDDEQDRRDGFGLAAWGVW